MRPQLAVLLLLFALPLFGEEDELRGAFDRARAALAKGDHAQCRAAAAPVAKTPGPLQAAILATLGNCLDMAGETRQAIETHRAALALAPENPVLLYNLAATLAGDKQYGEARELLKKAVIARPRAAASRSLLAKLFDVGGFRVAALLEYLRFLALEPSAGQSREVATRVVQLLNQGVEKRGPKDISLNIASDSPADEGNYRPFETMLALASGARFLEKNEGKTEFEIARDQLYVSLAMFAESPIDFGSNFTATQNRPFFKQLHERKLLGTYAGLVLSSLKLAGGDAWQKENAQAISELQTFLTQ